MMIDYMYKVTLYNILKARRPDEGRRVGILPTLHVCACKHT